MPLIVPDELHGELVTLRRYRLSDMDAVRDAIDASFDELNRWMPWAAERPTVDSVRAFVEPSSREFGGATAAANYAIVLRAEDRFVGSCGLMQDLGPHALEIGYWVDTRYTGRGIATQAARLAAEGIGFRLDRTEEVPLGDGRIAERMIWTEHRRAAP